MDNTLTDLYATAGQEQQLIEDEQLCQQAEAARLASLDRAARRRCSATGRHALKDLDAAA